LGSNRLEYLMSVRRFPASVFVALAALPAPLSAQAPAASGVRSPPPVASAARLEGSISIDGRLDETAWRAATPIGSFRQYAPAEGAPASLPTEVRLLYDDGALYIGARMDQPGGVAAPLARRDQLLDASGDNGSFNSLTTDKLVIDLDPYHNHIDDACFEVNPMGVKGDQFNGDPSWDPVWDAAARVDSLGWTAEIRIPYSQLRFSRDTAQVWGMQIWRYIDGLNERDMWSFWPRNASGGPAFYGDVTGLRIAHRPRQFELLPYVVAGGTFERSGSDDPYHHDREGHYGVGGDIKYLLTSNLTLDATLNPDFARSGRSSSPGRAPSGSAACAACSAATPPASRPSTHGGSDGLRSSTESSWTALRSRTRPTTPRSWGPRRSPGARRAATPSAFSTP
jgi:hypothetical protein